MKIYGCLSKFNLTKIQKCVFLVGSDPAESERPQQNFNSPRHKQQVVFNIGDKVKVLLSAEELQKMQTGHGGWNPRMAEVFTNSPILVKTNSNSKFPQCVGKLGVIHRVTDRGDIRVQYGSGNQRWTFHPAALKKVRAFLVGEVVRVLADPEQVKANQEGHGDWVDAMMGVLGKVGVVQEVYSDGDLRVAVKGQPVWTMNPNNVEAVPLSPEKRSKISEDFKSMFKYKGGAIVLIYIFHSFHRFE
jgi:Mind bomb SH3 repeat domain